MSIFNNNLTENYDHNDENNENDEIYEPVEPLKYTFNALSQLNTNVNIIVPDDVKEIYVINYRVNSEKKYPFLEYLLLKTHDGLDFLKISKTSNNKSVGSVLSSIDTNLSLLLFGLYSNENNANFVECYKGFKIYDNKMYMFLDVTKMNIHLIDIYRTNGLWFCLIDEIMNMSKVCDIDISKNVLLFFCKSYTEPYQYFQLYDEDNNPYEVPKVAYVGINKQKLIFTYTFGVSKKEKTEILGPYYYFTNFKNAIKQGSKSNIGSPNERYNHELKENELREDTGGIIRFALFLGKTKVKTNSLTEDVDSSDIKREKLSNDNENTNYERATIRISDHDGNWANDYDTVILEDILLDDYVKVKNTPMYVCKEYQQQIPLSYHYINKKAISDGCDSSMGDFLIL